MALSRKDFVDMADRIAYMRPEKRKHVRYTQWLRFREEMAAFCSRQNRNFDYSRFIDACNKRWAD
jgi:hypothetical protein